MKRTSTGTFKKKKDGSESTTGTHSFDLKVNPAATDDSPPNVTIEGQSQR